MKINYKLLPIKAHYFFFMAALGPILHQLNVFGKQLGVSEMVIGSINFILPFLFLLAKPVFGFIADYFHQQRKLVFISLVCSMNLFYILMCFIPQPAVPVLDEYFWRHIPISTCDNLDLSGMQCGESRRALCNLTCADTSNGFDLPVIISGLGPHTNSGALWPCLAQTENSSFLVPCGTQCDFTCKLDPEDKERDCLYGTATFWSYLLLMSLGTIGFNVANSVSDAVCFDILGDGEEKGYGMQRVWGTIGFGITALISGKAVDMWSSNGESKNYTPAFLLVFIFGAIDVFICTRLKLPALPQSKNILKDLGKIMRHKHVVVFVFFCVIAGVIDSFIIYYLFWYLEDLSTKTNNRQHMKTLEGLIIAAETLFGEVIFFVLSGKILGLLGYGHSLTLCFMSYALRMGLISIIQNPWWFLPVELFMQGPTYALSYTTIVVYASAVSPPGTSATMQGIVAGMDDGFGYAVGSFIGGFLYQQVGGSTAFKIFALTALISGIVHFVIYECFLKRLRTSSSNSEVEYKMPIEAVKATITETQD